MLGLHPRIKNKAINFSTCSMILKTLLFKICLTQQNANGSVNLVHFMGKNVHYIYVISCITFTSNIFTFKNF